MQIFEITARRRQKIDEITLGGIGQAIGSVGKALAQTANVKAGQYVQQQTGIDPSNTSGNPYGAQQSRAAAAAKPVIDQQAKQQQKLWNTALTKTMQSMNVSDPRALPSSTKQEMARSLMSQIHTNFLQNKVGRDYTQLPNMVDGGAQQDAQDIVRRITAAKQDILNFNAPVKDPVKSLADWQTLSQAAYDAMALTQFRPGSGVQPAGSKPAGQQQSPQAQAAQNAQANLMNKTSLTPSMLSQIQAIVGPLPAVKSADPRTQAYLAALGFKSA